MSLTKQTFDDDALAERMQRGWDEVYYGQDWPSQQECLDDERQSDSDSYVSRPYDR